LEIVFDSIKLQRTVEDPKKMEKKFGSNCAKRLRFGLSPNQDAGIILVATEQTNGRETLNTRFESLFARIRSYQWLAPAGWIGEKSRA